MDFAIPEELNRRLELFNAFLETHLKPGMAGWYEERQMPRSFFQALGRESWHGFEAKGGQYSEHSMLQQALVMEAIAKISPGVAVAVLANASLGIKGLFLFGSEAHKKQLFASACLGDTLICAGNTEKGAGSDVASIEMRAEPVEDGWILNGAKGYVTNGMISNYMLATAVTDPASPRNRRLSLFLVDLSSEGVSRHKLNKQVWVPSDLTRIGLKDVFVPRDHLMGIRGKGLSHILEIFTNSRITISALTLGTAAGALALGMERARRRKIFGKRIADFQAKSFEMADLYTRVESARLLVWKACWAKDRGQQDFRLEASMGKYLSVEAARQVSQWAADLFGAASVVLEHPVHKYPMDVWGSSLGEGTQDVQKLIIFREIFKED